MSVGPASSDSTTDASTRVVDQTQTASDQAVNYSARRSHNTKVGGSFNTKSNSKTQQQIKAGKGATVTVNYNAPVSSPSSPASGPGTQTGTTGVTAQSVYDTFDQDAAAGLLNGRGILNKEDPFLEAVGQDLASHVTDSQGKATDEVDTGKASKIVHWLGWASVIIGAISLGFVIFRNRRKS